MNFEPTYNEKSWYTHHDPKPPKDYNPYNDNPSVIEEVCKENAGRLGGTSPLSWESPQAFGMRRAYEDTLIKSSTLTMVKNTGGSVSLILLLVLLLMNSLSSAATGFLTIISEQYTNLFAFALMALQYVALFPIVFYIATVGNKNKSLTYFKKTQISKFYTFRWIIIILGITYATAIVFNLLFTALESLGIHTNDLSSPLPTTNIERIVFGITVVILAPIFEEILFRGILLTKLSRYGGWFAAITTGVLFGLFHQNTQQLFFATAFGILAGFITLRAKSIYPSLIAHICLNGYSFLTTLLLSFADNGAEYVAGATDSLEGSAALIGAIGILDLLLFVVIIIGIIMLIVEATTNKSQFALPKSDSGLRIGEKFLSFALHPLSLVLFLVIISNIITYSFLDMEAMLQSLEQMA